MLTLEITEGELLADDPRTFDRLQALRTLGVRLSLDDFGTGYSGLSSLRRYPIDVLKIDRSFIAELTSDSADADVLIRSILSLAENLGIDVIAEGVKTEGQLQALRDLGATHAQGFLFARPARPDVIRELIRAGIELTAPAHPVLPSHLATAA